MFVSGLPLQEIPTAQKRYRKCQNYEAYDQFLHDTSILIPLPPALYSRLPTFIKRTVLLEFPMYVFSPTEGDDDERRKSLGERDESPRESGTGRTGDHPGESRV